MALPNIPTKVTQDDFLASEMNQIIDAIQNGTLEINPASIRIAGNTGTNGQILTSNGTTCYWQDSGAGSGDMTKAVYDPTNVSDDAFNMENMAEGVNNKIFSSGERSKLTGIEAGAEVNNISDANATDLTDGTSSTLHFHSTDRDRSNHTGTQTASTISDFDTEVSNNSSVVANTAKVSNATHTGDVTGSTVLTIANDAVDIPMLSATGTPSASTFLRGDNTWATPVGGDVSKVGTPVNNQLAVWTGDGTLEGESDITYDSLTRYLTYSANSDDNSLLIKPDTGVGFINSPYWAMRTYNNSTPADMNFRVVRTGASEYNFEISDTNGTMVMTVDESGNVDVSGNITVSGTVDGIDIATDVAANTAARHVAVTVSDSAEIDFTLTGQQISASIVASSIDESKLDASVNASLDLADSSVQPSTAPILTGTNFSGVPGGSLTDDSITEVKLDCTNAPTDNYILSYDSVSGGFTWVEQTSGFTDPMTTRGDIIIRDATNTTNRLGIGTTGQVLTSDGTDVSWGNKLANVVDDTTPELGGDLDLNSNGMKLTSQTVGGSNGDLVYLSGANTWSQTDADAESTSNGMLGIRISATEVLIKGVYTTTGLTAASTYYVSTTAGGITTTAPSATGDVVRIVGYALSTTELFFDPDKSYVVIT